MENTSCKLPIYFDYAATTPVDPRVAEKMVQCLTREGTFGNPASSSHRYGSAARCLVEEARKHIAALVNANHDEIIFTSGATESDNLAILGAADFYQQKGKHIITSQIEHKAVLDACHYLETRGFSVTYLKPDARGFIDPASVQDAIRADTILVSIMQVNNEIGAIQAIHAIGTICRERDIVFHVDAAQSAGKIAIDLQELPVDLMSFSAHKIYGPKGIGALFVRRKPRVRLTPLIHGGGHEQGLRSGTLATHQIVGMGEAFRIASLELENDYQHLQKLREKLRTALDKMPGISCNSDLTHSVPGIMNFSVGGVDGGAMMVALKDLAISSGSACNSSSIEPSYVLRAIGLNDHLAHSSFRLSMGRFTTESEIDDAIQYINDGVAWLRSLSPVEIKKC